MWLKDQASNWPYVFSFADGHAVSNGPALFRPPKSSGTGPGQYWCGGPPGKTSGCCQLLPFPAQAKLMQHPVASQPLPPPSPSPKLPSCCPLARLGQGSNFAIWGRGRGGGAHEKNTDRPPGTTSLHTDEKKQQFQREVKEMPGSLSCNSISGLVVEYIVAIDVTRVRFPADAFLLCRPSPAHQYGHRQQELRLILLCHASRSRTSKIDALTRSRAWAAEATAQRPNR